MEPLRLPPRLARIAALVPMGARIADVGTDHGLLPIWLREQGVAVSAVATDIRPGPLSRAESLMHRRGVTDMSCRLCDGLAEVDPSEADTVIIAGMGGENMAEILRKAPWTASGCLLLMQPMSRPEVLRTALKNLGIAIQGEALVADAGHIYPILTARGGEAPAACSDAELYTGRYELVSREELFLPMLDALEGKLHAALSGLALSSRPDDRIRIDRLRRVCTQLEDMRRKYHAESL